MQLPRIVLLLSVLALTLIGLVMVFSTSSVDLVEAGKNPLRDTLTQGGFALAGAVLIFILWKFVPYRAWLGRLTWFAWLVGIALIVATALFGTDLDTGARRWLYVGSIGGQPSEIVKITLLLMTIRIIADARSGTIEWKACIIQLFLLVLIPLLIQYRTQSDLGTTLIIVVGAFAVAYLGGISTRLLGAVAVIGAGLVVVSIFGSDYRSGRMVYLDPWNDGEGGYGSGYNIIRSYYAIAEGGLFGVGLGNSHEKFAYLFASESDFIFSIVCEELGMAGALLVIALFLAVLWSGLRIAAASPDDVGAMIAGGCSIMLVAQAFLNMGCAIGVLPTTGKPLPFISSGGTALIASMVLVGLVLSVSAAEREPSVYERRRADLRIVRAEGARR